MESDDKDFFPAMLIGKVPNSSRINLYQNQIVAYFGVGFKRTMKTKIPTLPVGC